MSICFPSKGKVGAGFANNFGYRFSVKKISFPQGYYAFKADSENVKNLEEEKKKEEDLKGNSFEKQNLVPNEDTKEPSTSKEVQKGEGLNPFYSVARFEFEEEEESDNDKEI